MVLLVVDVQNLIVTPDLYHYDLFVSNVRQLIHFARKSNVEIVYICHEDGVELVKGEDGFNIFKDFAPFPGEKIFDKHVNSAFRGTGLTEYLHSKNESQVMIAGLQTDYCIDATIKCGFEHGFEMIVPADCNTTVSNEYLSGEQSYRYYNEKMWNRRYAKCVGFEDALSMLKSSSHECKINGF